VLDEPKLSDLYEFIIKVVDERVKEIKVTREDFNRLQEIIADLAETQHRTGERIDKLIEAQSRTGARVSRLEEAIADLAEAQGRTEARINRLEEAITKLAEAQGRTEARINRLEEAITKLAEAQHRTEERIDKLEETQRRTEARVSRLEEAIVDLAEAQRETEERLNKLAEAQHRTEESLNKLIKAVREQNVKIERLSDVVGFGLEDIARVVLPGWLHRHLSIEMNEFRREFLSVDGKRIEINLYGEGVMKGERVIIIGECKSRIYKRDVERFYRRVYTPVKDSVDVKVLGVMFGYLIYPDARKRAEELGLYVVASYER